MIDLKHYVSEIWGTRNWRFCHPHWLYFLEDPLKTRQSEIKIRETSQVERFLAYSTVPILGLPLPFNLPESVHLAWTNSKCASRAKAAWL